MTEFDPQCALVKLDELIDAQVAAIMAQPTFVALERAWRGLWLLVNRLEPDQRLQMLTVSLEDLRRDAEDAPSVDYSGLYALVYRAAYLEPGALPYTFIVADYSLELTKRDVATMRHLALVGSAAFTPVIAAAPGALLDVGADAEPSPFDALREEHFSRFLVLCTPDFVLRDSEPPLLGRAALVLATRMLDSHARYRWCANMVGLEGGGLAEGVVAEVAVDAKRDADASHRGLAVLGTRGDGRCVFRTARSVQRPLYFGDTPEGKEAELTHWLGGHLPHLMIACLFGQLMKLRYRDHGELWNGRMEIQRGLSRGIYRWVPDASIHPPEHWLSHPLRRAQIEVEQQGDQLALQLKLQPYFKCFGERYVLHLRTRLDPFPQRVERSPVAAMPLQQLAQVTPILGPAALAASDIVQTPKAPVRAVARGPGVWLLERDGSRLLRWLPGRAGRVRDAIFSPDGSTLYLSSGEGISTWQLARLRETALWGSEVQDYDQLAMSPDGALLLASRDCAIDVWDVATEALTSTVQCAQLPARIGFASDGRTPVYDRHRGAGVFRVDDTSETAVDEHDVCFAERTEGPLDGYPVRSMSLAFHPAGELLATATEDGTIWLWDLAQGAPVRELQVGGRLRELVFSADGEMLAASWYGGTYDEIQGVRRWSATSGELLGALELDRRLWAHELSTERMIASALDVTSEPRSALVEVDLAAGSYRPLMTPGVKAALSADGRLLATGEGDEGVAVRDYATMQRLQTLRVDSPKLIRFSPDAKRLACESGTIAICELDDEVSWQIAVPAASAVWDMAWSPDGETFAWCAGEQGYLWDPNSRQPRCTLRGHRERIRQIVVSPDSRLVATASSGSVQLWSAATGERTAILAAVGDGWLAVKPDGRHKASADPQGALWLAEGLARRDPSALRVEGEEPLPLGLEGSAGS